MTFIIATISGIINLMPLTKNEISTMIMSAFPDATLELKDIAGDSNHYSAKISSKVTTEKPSIHA